MTDRPRSGAELIAAERRRQLEVEGYMPEDDESTGSGALALAGAAYAVNMAEELVESGLPEDMDGTDLWPWNPRLMKLTGDRVRDLVKAGALIAAAIDVELAARERALLDDPSDGHPAWPR